MLASCKIKHIGLNFYIGSFSLAVSVNGEKKQHVKSRFIEPTMFSKGSLPFFGQFVSNCILNSYTL